MILRCILATRGPPVNVGLAKSMHTEASHGGCEQHNPHRHEAALSGKQDTFTYRQTDGQTNRPT